MPVLIDSSANLFEPNWQKVRPGCNGLIPAHLACWVLDRGSLTSRIQAACDGCFRVQVLHQGWGRGLHSENRLLGVRNQGVALIREVHLYCDDHPWVFARSIIPATSLVGDARQLAHTGTRPLGALLFSNRKVRRDRMEFAAIRSRHSLHSASQVQSDETLWGRRSVFHFAGKPLLVNEIFLPDLPPCRHNRIPEAAAT